MNLDFLAGEREALAAMRRRLAEMLTDVEIKINQNAVQVDAILRAMSEDAPQ